MENINKRKIIYGYSPEGEQLSIKTYIDGTIGLSDSEYIHDIRSKEDAENLIKALQKAIELNWWE